MYLELELLLPLHLLHALDQHLRLPLLLLSLLESLDLPQFDLVHYHFSAPQRLLLLADLYFLLLLDFAQPLQLHDLVLLLLLHLELLPVLLLLLELALANGGSLCIGYHFVHLLHVVQLLLADFDCSLVYRSAFLQSFLLELIGRQSLLLLLLQTQHLLSFGLCERQFVLFLLLGQPALLL